MTGKLLLDALVLDARHPNRPDRNFSVQAAKNWLTGDDF